MNEYSSPHPRNVLYSLKILLALVALGACGDGGKPGGASGDGPTSQLIEELRDSGIGKYLGTQEPSRVETDGAWTHYFFDPAEKGAVCLVGDPFQVSVRDGPSDDVLLYLQGGGACWDRVTCHVINTASKAANGPVQSGIIASDNAENPFRDFDIVYVPYCDGSVFTGDAVVDYGGIETYHHGLRNLSVGIDAMVRSFPNPARVVVAGSSAGGYGTYSGYGATRLAYPDTPVLVFNDSGPGVQNLEATEDIQNRVANWNFTNLIPETCTECDVQYSYLTPWALERDPLLRSALYSYQQDGIISFFLGLTGPALQELLLDVTGDIHSRYPDRFVRYMPQGGGHTILLGGNFYTQEVENTSILEWTRAFLDDPESWTDIVE